MAVTMKDVAKLAGVSLSTVSRVLNNSSLVKEKTAEKVKKAVKKLNYQVDDSARILRTQKSNLIGFIGAGMGNPFLTKLLKGVETTANEKGYNILYGDSDGEYRQEINYLNIMRRKKIDGIIILSANIYTDLLKKIKRYEIPVVFASGYINDNDIACVTVDNVNAAHDVIDYFIKQGHKKVGIISGPYSDTVASEERIKGVRLAYKLNNKEFSKELIVEGEFNFESGYTGAKTLLEKDEQISAIFAFNDVMAIGALKYLKSIGKKIPEDISVIGFDDIELAQYVNPQLSTVAQSPLELGANSVELLDKLIKNKDIEENKIIIPHNLILRESTR